MQPIVLDDQGGSVMSIYEDGVTGTLRAQTHGNNPIVFQQNASGDCFVNDVMHTLGTNSNATGRNAPNIIQPMPIEQLNPDTPHIQDRIYSHTKGNGCNTASPAILHRNVLVRRLTPLECCRLQGFPDNWAAIPMPIKQAKCGKEKLGDIIMKPAPDSPQYQVYGNSMTTNVMHWIGKRIKMVDDILTEIQLLD